MKDYISNLKLRVGWGVTGNQSGIDPYTSLMTMGPSGSGRYYDRDTDTWPYSYTVTRNANPDLKWESTEQTNIGVDISLFNRFNVTVDYYYKLTSDLLYTYQVPNPPYLYGEMLANVGDLSNRGVEITIGAEILKEKEYSLNADFTVAHNKMVVERLSNDAFKTSVVQKGSVWGMPGMDFPGTQRLEEGSPVGTFYGPRCDGIATEDMDVYDGDKLLYTIKKGEFLVPRTKTGSYAGSGDAAREEWENLGSVQPAVTLGFALNGSWRDFDFTLSTYGMFGQKVLNAYAMCYTGNGTAMNGGANVTKEWVAYGFSNTSNKMKVNYYSSYWIEDASYLRLQNAIIGYTLPKKWAKALWIQKLRVYVEGDNLLTFTGYSGLDPEMTVSTNSLSEGDRANGIDWGTYPVAKCFTVGVNLTF